MVKNENGCVGCTSMGLPCRGDSCPNRNVVTYFCDKCGDELGSDEIYDVDGEELCEYCLKQMFKKEAF